RGLSVGARSRLTVLATPPATARWVLVLQQQGSGASIPFEQARRRHLGLGIRKPQHAGRLWDSVVADPVPREIGKAAIAIEIELSRITRVVRELPDQVARE